jgi:hypothetical protein
MEEKKNAYKVWVGKPERKYHLESLGRDGSINLKWV